MSAETIAQGAPDEALLRRVQQDNQRQILGKLLHDLRNPIHSIRISMELFGRLARRHGDLDKLVARAAAYIGPAEMALESLLTSSARLSSYLAAPAAVKIAPVVVNELLAEVALLLRSSLRRLRVTCIPFEADPMLRLAADRVRLSHALLHCCLNNSAAGVALSVREESPQIACIEANFEPGEPPRAGEAPGWPAAGSSALGRSPLSAEELGVLIATAGGKVAAGAERSLSLSFRRSSDPDPRER